MKTMRQRRYQVLVEAGFLKSEAIPLSRVPHKSVPYMKEIIKNRQDLYNESRKQGLTLDEYRAKIKELYKSAGFMKQNKIKQWLIDVWAMFREVETRYIHKHPEYHSPWLKRQHRFRNFASKVDRSIIKGYYKR